MTTPNQLSTPVLDSSLILRHTAWSDLEAVTQLILDVCTADGDPTVAVTSEELAREWKSEDFTLETDAWVVEAPNGQIVGYEEFSNRHIHAKYGGDGYVHPDYLGRGIGTAMLRALDERALEEMKLAEPDLRVYIRNGLAIGDRYGREMHEAQGYQTIRFSWHMEIKLDGPAPAPIWPEGVEVRPFVLVEHNQAVFEAHEEAFSDHWGHTPGTYADWQTHMTNHEDFDPSLWIIAWDGDQIAGYSLCRFRMGAGWVGSLGVRRPWRKRGLGMALLLQSFHEFQKRSMNTIGLGVDASNPTGATRLYQKAGMGITAEYVIYEKEYRPGREVEEE